MYNLFFYLFIYFLKFFVTGFAQINVSILFNVRDKKYIAYI